MNEYGYVAFYQNQRHEIHAPTMYAAVRAALEHFKPPRSKKHLVHVVLAETPADDVVHVASE